MNDDSDTYDVLHDSDIAIGDLLCLDDDNKARPLTEIKKGDRIDLLFLYKFLGEAKEASLMGSTTPIHVDTKGPFNLDLVRKGPNDAWQVNKSANHR